MTAENGLKVVHGSAGGLARRWAAEELLVGTGRSPAVEGLGLEEIGVRVGEQGIITDGRARTSVPSIYATGDVAGRFLFTHWAGYESAMAVRDMFFPGKAKLTDLVPSCIFTDPELAHAGLTAAEARERHKAEKVAVRTVELSDSDRARTDGATEGAIILVTARGRLVGAHVLAPAAGELIPELSLAIRERLRLENLAELIHVYPTVSTSVSLLSAEAAYERAKRYGWLIRSGRRS